jgi:hypothetical protein
MHKQVLGDGSSGDVVACGECSQTVQLIRPEHVEARFEHLHKRYVVRYRLDRPVPEWDDEEIQELGYSLGESVRAHIHKRQRALQRTVYLKAHWARIKRLLAEG